MSAPGRVVADLPREVFDSFAMERSGEEGHLQAAVARRRAGPLGQRLEDLEAGRDLRGKQTVGLVHAIEQVS